MQRRRARVWVTSRIIGRGVDNVDRVMCVLFGWRQSKRRISGAGWVKRQSHAGKRRSSACNLRPRPTKYRAGRIGEGERGDVTQDWDCISVRAALYDSTIFQVTLSDQSSREGSERGRPDGLSCIDREQGDPRSAVAYSPPSSLGGIAFPDFRKCSPQDKTG
jgi:hypothetical protein